MYLQTPCTSAEWSSLLNKANRVAVLRIQLEAMLICYFAEMCQEIPRFSYARLSLDNTDIHIFADSIKDIAS